MLLTQRRFKIATNPDDGIFPQSQEEVADLTADMLVFFVEQVIRHRRVGLP